MNHVNDSPYDPSESAPPFPTSLQRYESIVENAVWGVFQSTPDGRYLLANPALARLYGYDSPAEMVASIQNISVSVYADPSVRDEYIRLMKTKGEVRGLEYQVRRKDGSLIWISEHSRVVRDERGRLLYFEGFIEDITTRKEMEIQLRQAQKMEGIGRLAGGVAHDFNNILTAVIGYSELLRRSATDPESQDYIEAISGGAQRAAALCRQLLILSRRHAVLPRNIDMNTLVRDMLKLMQRLIGEDVTVDLELTDERVMVRADTTQLEQVVMNLVINSRDAMPNGGTITLRTRAVRLPSPDMSIIVGLEAGDYVEVSVQDTGQGMTPEVQTKLFEPFFTTKAEGKGTGLGLATCYNIVQQNKGQILVGSEVGVGTTVRFFLPMAEGEALFRTEFTDQGEGPRGTETVLVVEDEKAIRSLTGKTLRQLGYEVLLAENGVQALEVAKAHGCRKIDLLITDVMMPLMGGKELAYWLQLVVPELRVLFMSGYMDRALFSSGRLGDGVDFMQKPFGPLALARRVRAVLDEKRAGAGEAPGSPA